MFNIFAALKVLIARTGSSLGTVALSVIRDDFIPRLSKQANDEDNPAKQDEMRETLKLWNVYADEKTHESKTWEAIALKTINDTIRKFHLSQDSADDIEQDVAVKMFSESRMEGIFKKFNPADGPMAFMSHWKTVLFNMTMIAARDFYRQEPEHQFGLRDVDVEVSSPKQLTELDEQTMSEVKAGLDRFIAQRLSDDPAAIMEYKMWMVLAEQKGADEINFSKDIQPRVERLLKDKKLPHSHGTITNAWRLVVKTIVQYFEDELNVPISHQMKRQLKLAERLAYSEFRRRLAAWVLGR
jgi:hypothetical protein